MQFGVFNLVNLQKGSEPLDPLVDPTLSADEKARRAATLAAEARNRRIAEQPLAPGPRLIKERKSRATGVGRGRKRGQGPGGRAKYVALYRVHVTKTGAHYDKKFYPGQEGQISTFLANQVKRGNSYERLDAQIPAPIPLVIAPPPTPKTKPSTVVAEEMAARKKPVPRKVTMTEEEIARHRIQYENDVRYEYRNLAQELHERGGLDEGGYKLGLVVRMQGAHIEKLRTEIAGRRKLAAKLAARGPSASLDAELQTIGAMERHLRALTVERDARLAELNQRPLATKILKVLDLREQIAALRAEAKAWFKDPENQKQWKRYLRSHAAKVGRMPKGKRKEAEAPLKYPAHIQSKLNRLTWMLNNALSGTTKVEARKKGAASPAIATGKHLVIASEKSEDDASSIQEGPVAHLLTLGKWSNLDANGRNQFSPGETAALWKEFSGVVDNIVGAKVHGHGAYGWASLYGFDKDEMRSMLKVRLFELAKLYSPEMAKDNLAGRGVVDKETGKVIGEGKERSFRSFAIMRLNSYAKHIVRDALKQATKRGEMEPEELEAAEAVLAQDDEGVATKEQMRGSISSPFASAEDIAAVKDLQTILNQKLNSTLSLAILSRANLLNPLDRPSGGGGLKSWDEVAADVRKEQVRIDPKRASSINFLKQTFIRKLGYLFKPGAKWAADLTPSDKLGLREGLKALDRIIGARTASDPDVSSWRVVRQPKGKDPGASIPQPLNVGVHRYVTGPVAEKMGKPITGSTRQEPLLIVKPEVHSFWQKQARAGGPLGKVSRAPHFDPARELDLGMDVYGPPGMSGNKNAVPLNLRLKQMRAKHYAKVWNQMNRMSSKRLERLTDKDPQGNVRWVEGQQFEDYKRAWGAAQAAAARATFEQQQQAEADPTGLTKVKRVPLGAPPLVIKLKRGVATIENVPPEDVLKIAGLILRQRSLDVASRQQSEAERDRLLRQAGIRKSGDLDGEIAALFRKMRRLLKVG